MSNHRPITKGIKAQSSKPKQQAANPPTTGDVTKVAPVLTRAAGNISANLTGGVAGTTDTELQRRIEIQQRNPISTTPPEDYPGFLGSDIDQTENSSISQTASNGYLTKRPTLKNILDNKGNWKNLPSVLYREADFIYNKWYGIIPNNYMITLTRSNLPVNDEGLYSLAGPVVEDKKKNVTSGTFQAKVVAQAVTYIGKKTKNSLSTILNMSGGMKWDPIVSTETSIESNAIGGSLKLDDSAIGGSIKKVMDSISTGISGTNLAKNVTETLKGFSSGLFKDAGSGYLTYKILRAFAKQYDKKDGGEVEQGTGTIAPRDALTIKQQQFDPYGKTGTAGGIFARKSFGGVNKIRSTLKRAEGIDFTHEIKLNFQYSLKNLAYSQRGKGSINSKAAMLDIIGNLMALVMSNAEFYGGANRYKPSSYQFEFSTDIKELMLTATSTGILETLKEKIGKIAGSILTDIKGVKDSIVNTTQQAKVTETFQSSDISKADYENVFRLLFYEYFNTQKKEGGAFNLINMEPTSTPALLTGMNVGEWHIIVGNPFNPIARIGNLVCTSYSFNFPTDELGPDDFPTEIEFTISLKPGRPRDRRGVTNIFGFIHKDKKNSTSTELERTSSTRDSDIDDAPSKINLQEALRRSYFRPGELVGKNRINVGANALQQNLLEGGGLGAQDFLSPGIRKPDATTLTPAGGTTDTVGTAFSSASTITNSLKAIINSNSDELDYQYKQKEIQQGYQQEEGLEVGRFPNALIRLQKEMGNSSAKVNSGPITGTSVLPPNLFNNF
jgi:hypothetical protein